jgi:uncharacterized protein
MVLSKYTKIIENEGCFYVYNSLTNYFCSINKNLYKLLIKKKSKDTIHYSEIQNDIIWDLLINKRIICEYNADDFIELKSIIESQRRQSSNLVLTIAPTLDCNFSCPYCFENKRVGSMSDNMIDRIVNFILSYKNIDSIILTWFGGEPLLYPNIIEEIYNRITNSTKKLLIQNIITNGYFLNEQNLKLLNRCNIKSIQLSIDGLSDNHNKTKFTVDDRNTFETIIKNIDSYINFDFEMSMNIRVNIDKNNKNDFNKVFHFFSERYKSNSKIAVYPAFVVNNTNMGCNKSCFENNEEKFEFYKDIANTTNNTNYIYPSNTIIECAIRNYYTWVIDFEGNLYKCWEIIGNLDYKVGELTETGNIKITNQKILNRYLFGSDPFSDFNCSTCFYLPICRGGCPHKRIENDFNNGENSNCTYFKNEIDNYLIFKSKLLNT